MDKLTAQLYEAIYRYFATLSIFGYKNEKDINKLLIFMYITDMLLGPFSNFLTEDDYNIVNKALYNFYGTTCLLPYPVFATTTSILNSKRIGFNLRFTENEQIRNTLEESFRITE